MFPNRADAFLLMRNLFPSHNVLRHIEALIRLPLCPPTPGFFGMWTFGRSNKPPGVAPKKAAEAAGIRTLELTGDLIGHSGAVQVGLA